MKNNGAATTSTYQGEIAERLIQPPGEIGAENDERAVDQVDDVENAPHQREADRDTGIEAAQHQRIDQDLGYQHVLTLVSCRENRSVYTELEIALLDRLREQHDRLGALDLEHRRLQRIDLAVRRRTSPAPRTSRRPSSQARREPCRDRANRRVRSRSGTARRRRPPRPGRNPDRSCICRGTASRNCWSCRKCPCRHTPPPDATRRRW